MNKIKINGVEFELDLMDADVMEKVEAAIEKTKATSEQIQANKPKKISQAIRKTCQSVFECFNDIFGEGTDKRIFGSRVNMHECLQAFAELCAQVQQQPVEDVNGLLAKYAPSRVARKGK